MYSRLLRGHNVNAICSVSSVVRFRSHISVAPDEALEDIISRSSTVRPYSEVPGPRPLPLIGNTWRVLPYIGQYSVSDLARVSRIFYEKYGKVVKLSGLVGRPDLLFVFDCDEIEKVYRQEGPTPFRPSMPCLVEYKSKVRSDFFGDLAGVVGVHGEPWREFRTKVQKPILQPKIVKQYIKPIEDVTNDFIDRMLALRDGNLELPEDFDNEIHKWSLECIGRVALDVRLGCLDAASGENSEPQKIIDAAKFALRNVAVLELKMPFWRYLPSALWTKYVKNMDFFREVCMKYIDEAMKRLQTKDPESPSSELSLVERILANEPDPKTAYILALDLILVGIDTISMAVASILYQVATRPDVQEKLYEEVKRALPDKSASLTAQDLENLPYQRAFVKEVFRKYSTVIGNGRTLMNDMVIGGYHIPKGVQLVFPTIVTGNMEEYVNDASSFRPERWMKQQQQCPMHKDKVHPFASLPYGYGARMCLGRRFADLEIQVLLAKLIRNYKLEFNHDPLDYQVTFMYAPDGKLQFKMTPRDEQ
ncbi:Hypothetical predicted protein [Cloeon dipterum]|uniref:Cytochrome P450 n=1 Tax=Cloeon dipterum TaxID=197152 RepID=A0A8S1BY74_9INSE|nr:Hypothetical predicted protein [Cloeon dipterum]